MHTTMEVVRVLEKENQLEFIIFFLLWFWGKTQTEEISFFLLMFVDFGFGIGLILSQLGFPKPDTILATHIGIGRYFKSWFWPIKHCCSYDHPIKIFCSISWIFYNHIQLKKYLSPRTLEFFLNLTLKYFLTINLCPVLIRSHSLVKLHSIFCFALLILNILDPKSLLHLSSLKLLIPSLIS